VGGVAGVIDADGEAALHELREEQVIDEVLRDPRRAARGQGIELTIEFPGTGASEKRELEEAEKGLGFRARAGGGGEQVGQRYVVQLAGRPILTPDPEHLQE